MSSPAFLAYVFWHWMRPGTPAGEYEDALRAFQETLAANAPPGLRRAAVFRQGAAPWLPATDPCYVDWYVIDDSGAMDPLNDAAVSAACRATHDVAAAGAAGGTAGLYGLRGGIATARGVTCATWFSKPAGMTYAALDDLVAGHRGERPSLFWSRRMTLGPGPELCHLGAEPLRLPAEIDASHLTMALVWPADRDDTRHSEVPLS